MSHLWGADKMAERFSGKYSPSGTVVQADAARQAPIAPLPSTRLLFILPFLFAVNAFFGTPTQLLYGFGAFAALLISALFTREGMVAKAAFDARRVARRPALPRKLLGAMFMAVGLFLGARVGATDPILSILLGLVGLILHITAFGADPMRSKGAEGIDQFQTDRVARYIDEAEGYLAGMKDAILRVRERGLELRVETFAETARGLFRSVENDPGDLSAARKYLTVYLMGARDATIKFADHYSQTRDNAARAQYEALLRDLETTFASRSQALIGNGKTGLDIEIDVLRERLKLNS